MVARSWIGLLFAMQLALLGICASSHQSDHGTTHEQCAWCVVLDQVYRVAPPSIAETRNLALEQVPAPDGVTRSPPLSLVAVFFARGPPDTRTSNA